MLERSTLPVLAIAEPAAELPATVGLAPVKNAAVHVLSMVAHELRSPLQALATSAELLTSDVDVLDREQVHKMLAGMRRNTLWLQELVENLLCASALEEGRFRVVPQPIDLVSVVRETELVVEPLLAQKKQRLRLWPRGLSTAVVADPRRIGQVLVNLITNASKFSPAETNIDVLFAWHGEGVRVTVADRGPGLPSGGAGRLFEPFCRGDAAIQAGKPGAGLGLAIARSIIWAHGGRIGAENRPGGGARFWFELLVSPLSTLHRRA